MSCKQRLADGSVLELPDSFCPSPSPANLSLCGRQDCPPQWVTTNWSQVAHPFNLAKFLLLQFSKSCVMYVSSVR